MIKPISQNKIDQPTLQIFIEWGAAAHKTTAELIQGELDKLDKNDNYPGSGIKMPVAQFNALRAAIVIRQALKEENPQDYLRDALGQDTNHASSVAWDIHDSI